MSIFIVSFIKLIDDMDDDRLLKILLWILLKIYDSLIEIYKIPLSEVQSD